MALPNSSRLLKKIEKERESRVISYVTSQRQPGNLFPTKIAGDAVPLLYEHLKAIGETQKISLFLETVGGDLNAPWPIVNLIREYCREFEVIVPSSAKSAGTLICLGANKIIMTPLSQLSPVDPEGLFKRQGKQIRLEVEDVLGFVDFAQNKIGLNEQESLAEILKILSQEIPPSVLGSVNRTLSQIRALSEKLLKLHIKDINRQSQINQIVENLTQKLFSHTHSIGRREAKDLVGFKNIIQHADKIWETSDKLLEKYHTFMEEKSIFDPRKKLGKNNEVKYRANRALIESCDFGHVFEGHYIISKVDPDQVTVTTQYEGWKKYKRGKKK